MEKVVMVKLTRGHPRDRSFDIDFWGAMTPEARIEAAWDCVVDLVRMGRLREDQLELRRDVVRLVRRKG